MGRAVNDSAHRPRQLKRRDHRSVATAAPRRPCPSCFPVVTLTGSGRDHVQQVLAVDVGGGPLHVHQVRVGGGRGFVAGAAGCGRLRLRHRRELVRIEERRELEHVGGGRGWCARRDTYNTQINGVDYD